jgi:hypothetical protein
MYPGVPLDTNVVSELRRSDKANRDVAAWTATVPAACFFRNAWDFKPIGFALRNPCQPRNTAGSR